jgi:glycine cleavage system regulatory protein
VDAHGLEVRIAPSTQEPDAAGEAFDFGLVGQDQPGIVRQVTAVLAALDANIEAFKSWITDGPETGAPLFNMDTRVRLAPGMTAQTVQAALEAISAEIMVDISLIPPR